MTLLKRGAENAEYVTSDAVPDSVTLSRHFNPIMKQPLLAPFIPAQCSASCQACTLSPKLLHLGCSIMRHAPCTSALPPSPPAAPTPAFKPNWVLPFLPPLRPSFDPCVVLRLSIQSYSNPISLYPLLAHSTIVLNSIILVP